MKSSSFGCGFSGKEGSEGSFTYELTGMELINVELGVVKSDTGRTLSGRPELFVM